MDRLTCRASSASSDVAWEKIAPHAMHEINAYGKWSVESGIDTTHRPIDDPDGLCVSGKYPVMTPDGCHRIVSKARTDGNGDSAPADGRDPAGIGVGN